MSRVVAIHQPNYLPWLGYFYKIAHCDVFVFLDNVQYEKNGFTNRNKIKTSQGPMWLTVGVLTKGSPHQTVREVRIDNNVAWGEKHWKSMSQNYSKAPCFEEYAERFRSRYHGSWENLADLNEAFVRDICQMLGVASVEFRRASLLDVSGAGSELLAAICRQVGADTYLSGFSGEGYMEKEPFERSAVRIRCYDFAHPDYHQLWGEFVPNLSVVDLLFNEGARSLDVLKGICKRQSDIALLE
jgi:hypothetical protein